MWPTTTAVAATAPAVSARQARSGRVLSRSFFTNWSSRPDGAIPALLSKLQESVPETAFNGFTTLVYTPGEKEWQDCPNPDGRLPAIRRIFFSGPTSIGTRPIAQVRQPGVPENARWERGGVLFATLDVPGPGGGGPANTADAAWLDSTFDP